MDDFCEDIEMMETDDNYNEMNDFANKRSVSDMNDSNSVSISDKLFKKSLNVELRHQLKAKRVLPKKSSTDQWFSCETSDENKLICVLDTNILLSNLIELKNVIISEEKSRKMANKSKLKSLVIPWIVVQELDHLKTRKTENKLKSVINVIHFINEQLKKSNGLVKGENELKSNSNQKTNRVEEEVNDDKILNCCLKFNSSPNKVVLVSNDLNLCNKALMNGLNAMDWKEFHHKYNDSKLDFIEPNPSSEVDDREPKAKKLAKNHSFPKSMSNHRLSLSPKFSFSNKTSFSEIASISPESHLKPTSPDKSLTTKSSIRKLKSPIKRKIIRSSPKAVSKCNDVYDSVDTKPVGNDCPLKYDDWIAFRDECEQKLLKFIESVYKDIWGKDWQQMLEIDVKNTNLKDTVRVVRKQWFANFSDYFNRDKTVKSLIDRLHTSLQQSDANYHLFHKDLQQLVDLVQHKSITGSTNPNR